MTTFADILPVEQFESNRYSANFENDWCMGDVPNGGYVTSAFMIVGSRHMQLNHAKRNQKHVINLHLEFVRKSQIGRAIFTVKEVKIGSRISNLHLTLSQQDDKSDTMTDRVEGYITVTDMLSENGESLDTGYHALPEPLQVSLPDLTQNTDANYVKRSRDPVAKFRRATVNMDLHLVRPEKRPSDFPTGMIDQWVRFRPAGKNGKLTNDSLGFVVDIFPQIVETYINSDLEVAMLERDLSEAEGDELRKSRPRSIYWYPTLLLNLDVKKALPEKGAEWLFVRIQAYKIQRGRFDLQITVLDEDGDLVATSSHSSLVVDSSRNTKKPRVSKQSKI